MKSCLYKCEVMHYRLKPLKHWFKYKTFMFYLDLDEIELFSKTLWFFSRNKFNIYNFRDKDHLNYGAVTVKKNLLLYLNKQGINEEIDRIVLLTNVAIFGYNFNPVSFYFCFDKKGNPICAVPEVGNTFGEIKPFLLKRETFNNNTFSSLRKKYFYVSPFIALNSTFEFNLEIPGKELRIDINDYDMSGKFFISKLTGKRRDLNDFNLFIYAFKFPLLTLKIITAIHWQALKLFLKKIPYHKKNENLKLQTGVFKNAGFSNR